MTNAEIQRALLALGYNLGRAGADGIWGALSRAAMSAFQAKQRLPVTGQPDARSLAALFPGSVAPAVTPLWHAEAGRLMGTREIAGRQHSGTIMGWAKRLKLAYADDETPWCGLFVAHCIAATLPDEPLPANPLGARNWLKFGRTLTEPALGAILVFWRGSKAGWSGHVGLYAGERADAFRVLGGNQSNAVTETWLAKDRLLGIRWPGSVDLPSGGRIASTAAGALSRNEA
jgi:uncharacterized protein (TIGR02594 family)